MKRIFFATVLCCAGYFATAQTKTDSVPQGTEKMKHDKGAYITLQGGQLIVVNDNKTEKLDRDKTLVDGTVVMINGVIKKPDGVTLQMKEGDRIYLDGGMTQSRKDKDPM